MARFLREPRSGGRDVGQFGARSRSSAAVAVAELRWSGRTGNSESPVGASRPSARPGPRFTPSSRCAEARPIRSALSGARRARRSLEAVEKVVTTRCARGYPGISPDLAHSFNPEGDGLADRSRMDPEE
jgi:hypothetical protein